MKIALLGNICELLRTPEDWAEGVLETLPLFSMSYLPSDIILCGPWDYVINQAGTRGDG